MSQPQDTKQTLERKDAEMTGAVSGRMAQTGAPFLEHQPYVARDDTVYVLDQKMSILLLDYDPGEGVEVLLPAKGSMT
jgi:hypothetical protein